MDLELFVDVLHMERNGVDGRPDLFGRRLVVVAFDQQFQQSQFVWREMVIGEHYIPGGHAAAFCGRKPGYQARKHFSKSSFRASVRTCNKRDHENDSDKIRQNYNLYYRSAFIPPNAALFPS